MGAAVAGDFPAHPHMAVSVLDRAPEGGREFRDGQFRNVDARFVHAGKVSAIGRAQSSWMFGGISTSGVLCQDRPATSTGLRRGGGASTRPPRLLSRGAGV